MLPWDYPVTVTWSSCTAFEGCVFSVFCVCVRFLSTFLTSTWILTWVWPISEAFSGFFLFHVLPIRPSFLLINISQRKTTHLPRVSRLLSLSLLTRCLKAVCLFTLWKSLWLMPTINWAWKLMPHISVKYFKEPFVQITSAAFAAQLITDIGGDGWQLHSIGKHEGQCPLCCNGPPVQPTSITPQLSS